MKKRHALILAILFTCLVASNFYVFSTLKEDKILNSAKITRIIDGDTLEVNNGTKIRLLNINAPEKDQRGHDLGFNFLKGLENKTVDIDIIGTDKYNRNLARIYTPDYINLLMVREGFASKFLVQESELKEFSKAEEEAISSSKGIWIKSSYYGCFSIDINKNSEVVDIYNKCKEVNMLGWILKDESRKIFSFKDFSIGQIKIHSLKGEDNSTDLFWQSTTNIWNNDRDSLYLFDNDGGLAAYEEYGY